MHNQALEIACPFCGNNKFYYQISKYVSRDINNGLIKDEDSLQDVEWETIEEFKNIVCKGCGKEIENVLDSEEIMDLLHYYSEADLEKLGLL